MLWTCIQRSGFEKDEQKVLVFAGTGTEIHGASRPAFLKTTNKPFKAVASTERHGKSSVKSSWYTNVFLRHDSYSPVVPSCWMRKRTPLRCHSKAMWSRAETAASFKTPRGTPATFLSCPCPHTPHPRAEGFLPPCVLAALCRHCCDLLMAVLALGGHTCMYGKRPAPCWALSTGRYLPCPL